MNGLFGNIVALKTPILLLISLFFLYFGVNGVVVKLTNGLIQGYSVDVNGVQVNVFKGIPFAAPPLGHRRFCPPQEPPNWTGILNATQYPAACMTNSSITSTVQNNTNEDCLYANVFADSRCSAFQPCPIVFMIHGGAFQGDSAIMFNETQLMQKYASDRFILVLSSYRLGILGLLDLGEELQGEPYNIAVHDMLFGLKWTQRELPRIGGNPQQITVFGYSSSGASLVSILASPKLDQSLFARAFISSGCPRLMPHYSESMGLAVSKFVGCNSTSNLQTQIECLRTKSAKELTDAMRATVDTQWFQIGIQSDSFYFPSPTLAGLKSHWRSKPLMLVSSKNEMKELELENKPLEHVCMHYILIFGYFQGETLKECVRYYKTMNETEDSPYYGDIWHTLSRDIQHAMNVMIATWNTQMGQKTYIGIIAQEKHDKHVDDLFYLIGFHLDRSNWTRLDTQIENFYVPAVKRFFRGEDPNDVWLPSSPSGQGYIYLSVNYTSNSTTDSDITSPQFHKNEVFNEKAVDFWLNHLKQVEMREIERKGEKYEPERMESIKRLNLVELFGEEEKENGESLLPDSVTQQSKKLHPFHNFLIVFIAIVCSVVAFAIVLMLYDSFKAGNLFIGKGEEANEQTVFFDSQGVDNINGGGQEQARRRYDAI